MTIDTGGPLCTDPAATCTSDTQRSVPLIDSYDPPPSPAQHPMIQVSPRGASWAIPLRSRFPRTRCSCLLAMTSNGEAGLYVRINVLLRPATGGHIILVVWLTVRIAKASCAVLPSRVRAIRRVTCQRKTSRRQTLLVYGLLDPHRVGSDLFPLCSLCTN